MGYRFVEDIDVSQSDFQTMLDELTDAKNSLVQHNGYMPRQWVFGLIPRVAGHMLKENSDLPNLDPEGRLRRIAEMRHKCRMAAIETEPNAKIRKSLIGRSNPFEEITCLEILCINAEQETVCIKHKVNGWDRFVSLELKEKCLGISSCDSYQVCKGTAAYGITRRARNARYADENWRRRSR